MGIVLSIAWPLFGYVYKNSSEIALWNEAYQLKYNLCKDIKEMNHARKVDAWTIKNNKEGKILGNPGYWDGHPDIDLQPCFEEGRSYAAVMHPYGFENALAFALLPIPFAWFAAYIVIAVGRWIRRGFA